MLTIESELKSNSISRFHLLYGQERYMVRYYKKSLLEKLTSPGDEMNFTRFHGKDIKPPEVAEVGQILPFMADQRVIEIGDSGFFKKANEMPDYLKDLPDSTYVIFVEREVDKRNRLYKWVSKNGCVTECQPQSEGMLKKWVGAYLKKEGKSIAESTVEYLFQRVGTDMETLNNEMEKLLGYIGEREVVERGDVEEICSGIAVSKIFDMIDAVASHDREKALRLYGDLLTNRESPMSILYLFSRHINILLQILELSELGMNKNECAKKIKIPPFTVPKYVRQAKLFRREQLLSMLRERAELEEDFKSGRISDQLAVEVFLIKSLTN